MRPYIFEPELSVLEVEAFNRRGSHLLHLLEIQTSDDFSYARGASDPHVLIPAVGEFEVVFAEDSV